MTIKATTEAYKKMEDINITPSNGLDRFIYYSELQTAESPVFLYEVDKAIVKLT